MPTLSGSSISPDQGAVVGPCTNAKARCTSSAAGCEGVGARLDGAPVVAGGESHRVDAVHDALVVSGTARYESTAANWLAITMPSRTCSPS